MLWTGAVNPKTQRILIHRENLDAQDWASRENTCSHPFVGEKSRMRLEDSFVLLN